MNLVKGFFNRKFIFFYSFLLLLIVFLYFNNRYEKQEISYAIIYIIFGMMISLFYILKDFIYNPDRLNYKQVIMEDALFNHKGEIIEEFESYPLYQEFVTFHLSRKTEDPYSETVDSLQAVRYIKSRMIDSLFIPLQTSDPLLKNYTLPLNEAIGRFLRYAGDLPIIIYNQPFTHTYLNVKLDKEVHISFIDAMKMSKDLYGIANKPLSHIQKYLKLYNLDRDSVADAKIVGAIYLDYIYTVSRYRSREAKKLGRKGLTSQVRPLLERKPVAAKSTESPSNEMNRSIQEQPNYPQKRNLPENEKSTEKQASPEKKILSEENKHLTAPSFSTKVPEEERRIISHKETEEPRKIDAKTLERLGRNLSQRFNQSTSQLKKKLSQDKNSLDDHQSKPKDS